MRLWPDERSFDPRRDVDNSGGEESLAMPGSRRSNPQAPLHRRSLPSSSRRSRQALPAIVFFAIGFNLIVLTTQLILDDYEAQFAGFMVATMAALVVGKAVLVAKLCPSSLGSTPRRLFSRSCSNHSYTGRSCSSRIFWKSSSNIWWVAGGSAASRNTSRPHFGWHRFGAIQIWIFVLFLVFSRPTNSTGCSVMASCSRSSLPGARRNRS